MKKMYIYFVFQRQGDGANCMTSARVFPSQPKNSHNSEKE